MAGVTTNPANYSRVGQLVHYQDASKRIWPALIISAAGSLRNLRLLSSRVVVSNVPLMTHRAAAGPAWYPGSRYGIPQ
jgi:hypothetical protein